MAKPSYKLSTVLVGHELDVRNLAVFADGSIVSASRDKTARVWKATGNGRDYQESGNLKGHTNFVSSVCVLNPSKPNATGFIITGSNDNTICVYITDQTEPIYTIKAHQSTVSNLTAGKQVGTFFSSSWDLTAKLWNINDLSKPELTLTGHTSAVWCAADLLDGLIVTASADKLVIVWTRNGSVKHKLTGHTDCVRNIATLADSEFLTCANDAMIRHWNASTGICIKTYQGHENYIYSIAAKLDATMVVSSGEDQTVRVWENGQLEQTIIIPAQSIWCVNLLPNGDIIAGDSEGLVRIFTADPNRYADPETLAEYEKNVELAKVKMQQQIGGINIKDIPDGKALHQAGQKDGQVKMINEGGTVKAYSWSQNEQQWTLIGTVMDASGGTAATSGKQLYNGIEYDYVFSVDIQDGVPPLKLPYNNGEDPWHVAQKFIHDNQLSQLFLDQVANFIVKNSKPAPTLTTTVQYADPFTGGSRYIPQTGASGNSPMEVSNTPSSSYTSAAASYIPHTKYLKLEQANLPAILDKLYEFSCKQNVTDNLPKEKLEAVVQLASEKCLEAIESGAIEILRILLNWPSNMVFPALDVARLAVLRKEANEHLCTKDIFDVVRRHIQAGALPSNQMLTFRLVTNMFSHEKGEKLILDNKDEILKALLDLESLGSKNNQVAISTFMLNLIVALNKQNDTPGRTRALNVLFVLLSRVTESEALFRALVGLGTLLIGTSDLEDRNELVRAVRQSEAALSVLRTVSENGDDSISSKLIDCSKQIINLIV